HAHLALAAGRVGHPVGGLQVQLGRVSCGDRLGLDEGDVVDVGGKLEVAAQAEDVEAAVGGSDIPGQARLGQGAAHPQVHGHVDLGGQVVLDEEAVAHGAHAQVQAQLGQGGVPLVKLPGR